MHPCNVTAMKNRYSDVGNVTHKHGEFQRPYANLCFMQVDGNDRIWLHPSNAGEWGRWGRSLAR